MKIYSKILLTTLPLVLLSTLVSAGVTYWLSRSALDEVANRWLESRLPEAVRAVAEVHAQETAASDTGNNLSLAQTWSEASLALHAISVGEKGFVFAITRDGIISVYPDASLVGSSVKGESWFEQMAEYSKGQLTIEWKGQKYLAIYDYYPFWKWYVVVVDPMDEVYGASYRAGYTTLFLALVGIMVVAIVIVTFTHRLTDPLSQLEKGAELVGQGQLDVRIPVKGRDEIGNFSRVFNQMTAQLQESTQALQSSEKHYRALIENSTDIILVLDDYGRITFASPSASRDLGYSSNAFVGQSIFDLLHPEDLPAVREAFYHLARKDATLAPIETRVRTEKGTWRYFEAMGTNLLEEPSVTGIVVNARDIQERKRAEQIQDSIYKISEAAHQAQNLEELFQAMQSIISSLMPAQNFYVALYDETTDTIHFPYYIDEFDAPPDPVRSGHGLTEFVLRTGESQLVNPARFRQLIADGIVDQIGALSIDWLGVPLKTFGKTIGVLVVQSYTENIRFGELEKEILTFVSEQAAMTIARKQAEEALRNSEARYRGLFENSPISLWEEDFSGIKETIDHLRLQGVTDFETYFKTHPEMVEACVRKLRVLDVNQATLRLFGAHSKEELINSLDRVFGKDTTSIMANELIAIAEGRNEYEGLGVNYKLDGSRVDFVLRWSISPAYKSSLSSLIVSIHDISGLKRAEAEVQNQLQRLNALRAIDASITGSLDLRATLNVLLEQVTSQLNVDAAAVLLLDSNVLTLNYAASRGFRTPALQHTSLRLGEGYAGKSALERSTLRVINLQEDPGDLDRSPLIKTEGFVAYFAVPLISKGQVKGVLEVFHRSPLSPQQGWLEFLETLARQAAIAIDNASLFDELQRSNVELTLAYDATIEGWSHALDLRDRETEGHTRRVTDLTLGLAQILGVERSSLMHIRWGALLHDIGKMGIPDSVLLKPGPLTPEEWVVMRQHPVYAYEMLLPIEYLRPALDIPYYHHEMWNGAGYPCGLKGEQIPKAARIFSVVDVWDALRSDRPYRKAWPDDQVREYIVSQRGLHFDPQVVDAFLKMVQEKN